MTVITSSTPKQHGNDLSLAPFFLATKTPFNASGYEHFKAFVGKLRPGILVPVTRKVTDKLLDETYDQEKGEGENEGE